MYFAAAEDGKPVFEYNSGKSLTPASIVKLITSAAALELLGPQYTFKTKIGYTGVLDKRTGILNGDIVIRGGGDPALGSPYFTDHYKYFLDYWLSEIKRFGIKKIEGRVITDDSYFDFQPVPAKWLWEDAGNYYGAGAYGLSVFDNTYKIYFQTNKDNHLIIKEIVPEECRFELSNWLTSAGISDEGYVFAAPYSTNGWMAGTIPINLENFVLKASIPDPPLLIAVMTDKKLKAAGLTISEKPGTFRLLKKFTGDEMVLITETTSPPLSEIIKVLNHESINLYAEHLIKELGKKYLNSGSTHAGVEVVKDFLRDNGIAQEGLFIEDGSGLSPANAINSKGLVSFLLYMRKKGKYFPEYYKSIPEAGKEGTLNNYFRDPVFKSGIRVKSGSMTRVRSYAGYFTTKSEQNIVFAIIVNNYSGPSRHIVTGIENIIKQIILEK
jgi:D-alanyl-D-alanine carboxypeptidase/D-alanyl-D-alanine-endopeptidase (penicillin-binding protein 4)